MRINCFKSVGKYMLVSGALLSTMLFVQTIEAANTASDKDGVVVTGLQQTKKIKGQVTEKKTGQSIIGASVLVKGTTNGAATDIDGNYQLDVPEGATLVVSYIGFLKQEIPVGAQTTINVVLAEDSKQMDEVVVVGYGTQRKASLTGAMQTVKADKLMDVTTPSVENMLSGKAPGVFVNSGSGRPGSTAKIVIRGKSTVNGSTDPLWVIDGVIVGSGAYDLNPSDVESMSVLKDAASTAIYGSMGANGVIVVTTKRGKSGKAAINVSAKLGISQLTTGNFSMMNGSELYDLYQSFSNQGDMTGAWYTPELKNRNYDWWDNGTQLGFAQDYNVSVSGGTDKLKAYVSVGLYDESGAVKGYDYTRYNARLNVDYQATDWLKIKPQINVAMRDTKDQQHDVGAMYRNLPWDFPYDEDGKLVGNAPNEGWVNSNSSNYLYDLQWNYETAKSYEIMGSFDFDVKLTEWLTFSSNNNYKFSNNSTMTYVDPRSSGGESVNGRVRNYKSDYNRIYTNQILRFNKTFNSVHSVNAIVAYEWNEYNSEATEQKATGIPPGFIVGDVAAVPEYAKGSKTGWAVQSFLMNANYAYDNKYLAQVSFRRDGASNFGNNAKYGNFFSVSAGWNIHQENFMSSAEWVNVLKLRASYGSVGNRPNSLYPQHATYSLLKGGYNELPGAVISQVKNDDLTWEKTYTTGVGLDATVFDRVTVTLDYYYKNTSDLLYNVPLPAVTGVSGMWRNVGAVKNQGFEATVNVDIFKDTEVKWSVEANIGLNRNKVDKLYGTKQEMIVGDGSGIAGSASKMLKPGHDVDSWYLTEWAGVDPETGKAQWFMTNGDGERVKTTNYGDASKNKIMIGAYTPKAFGGFSTNLSYKGLDLSAVFGFSIGGKIYNYSRTEFDSDGTYTDRNQMNLHKGWNRWEKPGDNATHPQAVYNNKSGSSNASSRFLEDGDFLRLRNLTLGYTIPVKSWGISNLRVFASGENLFVVTPFSGIDPEIAPHATNGITGVASDIYPQTRKYMFGVNLTF